MFYVGFYAFEVWQQPIIIFVNGKWKELKYMEI
jgi:hypothetical protein